MEQPNTFITKVRQLAVCAGFILVMLQTALAQNITRVEYFYDTDPGFGSGTAVTITPAANLNSLVFSASITSLSNGFHTLYVRSRDANNKWSLTANKSFVKYAAPTAINGTAGNIVKMEYFIDTDPGFGAATNVPVTASTNINAFNFTVPITAITAGFHTLYVRTKDVNGKWSLTQHYSFVKYTAPTALNGAAGNIVKMEYFIDTDPGFGAATNVPVTASANIQGQIFNVSLAAVSNGFHQLYIRTKDSDGKWSLTTHNSFVKYVAPTALTAPAKNIVKMEYFIDTDPGFGAATNVPLTAGLDISALVFNVPLGSITNGFHTLYVRSKDLDGKWSLTINRPFVKYAAPTAFNGTAGNIIKMEYFVDTDPGFGNGGNIPFTHSPNVSAWVANINLTSVANGFHTLYIRSMDTLGKWSLTNRSTFTGGQLQAPTASVTVNGPSTFCLGAGTYLSANYSASATYQWKLGTTNISGATGITYVPTQSGLYSVVVTNAISSATSSQVNIVVNPVPTATISANGPLTFCQGGSVTLSVNQTANATYQWRVNGSNTGSTGTTYAATASGVYDVVVTSSNGCSTTSARDTVTVNAAPGASITPSGSTTFCQGDSVVLFANTGAGLTYTWSNSATTSFIKVLAAGTYRVTVSNGTSCTSTASSTVTVLASPTATITAGGPTTFCNGSSVVLNANTGSGLSYVWSNGGATTASITVTSSGTYTVTVSNAGCSKVSSPVTVTVNPGPSVSISGTATICQGRPDTLTATGATTYSWSGTNLNTTTGAQVIATPSTTSTYTVTGTTSGCIGTATFTVNISPNNTTVSTTTPNICSGASAVLNASGAVTYAWSPSGTLSASTGASVTATPSGTTTYTVTGTSGACTSTATVTVNVNTTVTPQVSIATPQTTICAGTQVTFTATPTNGGTTPTYQWFKNGVAQSGNSNTYSGSAFANNDSVWVIMTSNATCPVPATATSSKIKLTVNPIVVPTISITVTQNPVCVGDPVTFTATITNGGANPVYQWKKNNVTVGSNQSTYTLTAPATNDSVWCILTSDALCATPATVTSAKIKMVVNQVAAATVTVSASQNPICTGATVTFNATPVNGGNTPSYQWYKNGNPVGPDADTYVTGVLVANDSVWVVMTSNATCASPLVATSNKVKIIVAPQVVPSVTVTGLTSVCAGASVTFTANPTNGGANPTYQWYKNNVVQPGNTNQFTSAVANNDSVWVIMTSNETCPVPTTATSPKLRLTVNPTVTPTIQIAASLSAICAGDSVTFTATITNGGANPVYQWKKNNNNVGNGTATYGTRALAAGDSVWCVLTSNAPCPSPASVTSNKLRITVNPILTPSVSIVASQNPICAGAAVTFTATPVNGGASPAYQWYKNGTAVGGGLTTYTANGLVANDSVWVVLTSNALCAATTTATSAKVFISVTPTLTPDVTIAATATVVCAGTSVTFTATPVNGGGSPTYRWYKNGTLQAGNSNTFSSNTLANNDSVWAILTTSVQCPASATDTSNKVYLTVNPTVTPTIQVAASLSTICAGDSVTFTATITNGGANPTYQWKKNNVNVGNGTATYGTLALAPNDSVWCVLTSDAACPSPSSVNSNKVRVTVNPITPPSVTITASQTSICTGAVVTFTATPINGGNAPDYAWFKNGTLTGDNASTYTDSTFATGDSVWVQLTSSNTCAVPTSASSSKVFMQVIPTVVPSVTIAASQTTLCAGTGVTFTATPVNGGATPAYQWFINGTLQNGSNGAFTTTQLSNNDAVWAVLTSNAACAQPAVVNSDTVTLTVLQPALYTYSYSICQGETYPFNGQNLAANGSYNDTLQAANGCDSIVTLNLTVNPVVTTQLSETVCFGEPFTFKGQQLFNPGTYRDTLSTVNGCDSFVVLQLQVIPQHTDSSAATICQGDGFDFYGTNLTASGIYRDTLTSSSGCDSIQVINLTVRALPVAVVTVSGNDTLRTGSFAKYQWFRNGQVLVADTNRVLIARLNGSYSIVVTDSAGCKSDTSSAVNVTGVGINETTIIDLQVYPNPTESRLNVVTGNVTGTTTLELRDDLGRLLYNREVTGSLINEQLDLSTYASGVYLLVIKNQQHTLATKRIFKN